MLAARKKTSSAPNESRAIAKLQLQNRRTAGTLPRCTQPAAAGEAPGARRMKGTNESRVIHKLQLHKHILEHQRAINHARAKLKDIRIAELDRQITTAANRRLRVVR